MAASVRFSNNDLQSAVKSRIIFLLIVLSRAFIGEEKEQCRQAYGSFSFCSMCHQGKQYSELPPRSRNIIKKRVAASDTEQEAQRFWFDFSLSLSEKTGQL
jgi:hypothetical protein